MNGVTAAIAPYYIPAHRIILSPAHKIELHRRFTEIYPQVLIYGISGRVGGGGRGVIVRE